LAESCGVRASGPRQFDTVRYEADRSSRRTDDVPVESPVDIYLCGTRLVTLQATPDQLVELAVGFVLTEGLLEDFSEYETSLLDADPCAVRIEARDRSRVLARLLEKGEVIRTSGCGRGTSFGGYDDVESVRSEVRIPPSLIVEMIGKMLAKAQLHHKCGGVHCSALAKGGNIVFISEDIGRHNTVDKVVGSALLAGVDPSGCLLLTTGRVSSEMIVKCARSGVPVIASMTSPTDLALDLAERLGISVVGYVRGTRLTVYTHCEMVGN
jgi:FdhD protein